MIRLFLRLLGLRADLRAIRRGRPGRRIIRRTAFRALARIFKGW